ncbi:MAG TPA: TonB-dependent receptor [Pedobacter sp.]|uniref:TonB-dependent receptor n=1 Tax=Pedobacter sp. TaxID=1411316 RepID=UPI002CD21868|nr:TonB-dependent receptor [Pedobacter sp.]HMI05694.1 TonB-dependent receptor [Pedobacter sp.]
MKSQLNLKKAIITALFVIIGSAVFAQTGRISGKVSDKKSGETLIGVTVKIAGTTKGMATDVDGKYSLTGLTTGKYTLVFQYVGYGTKEISDVEVTNAKNTIFDVILDEAGGQSLKEVVIKGSFKKESVNALYAQQKNSAVVSDGISSEAIKRSPDRNTSDVLKRVSGATIQDNKFVVVRGLSDRYNTAMLDGASLPSTEPNRKAFSFDIVPSNLVDNLIISKSATPDLPGDFTGGAIQIQTKDIPDQNFITVSAGAGYNSVATFNNFQSGPRPASDFFGFNDGSRNLSPNFPSRTRAAAGTLTPAQQLTAIKTLPQDWNIYNNSALPSQNYQFTIGRVKDLENNRKLGAIASITYRNSQTKNEDLFRDYNAYRYTDNSYKFSTNLGGLANFAYNFGNNKITFKNIYNKTLDDQYLYRQGNFAGTTAYKYYAFDLMEKSLLKSTLEGTHQIGDKNSKLVWTLAYSNIINDQPDQRKMGYTRGIADPESVPYNAALSAPSKENARLFTKLNEDIYSGSVNYSIPLNMFKKVSTLKIGGTSQYRSRDFASRFLTLTIDPVAHGDVYQSIGQRPIQRLFTQAIINSGVYQLNDLALPSDNYDGTSFINAGYAMLDNKIGEKLRVVWGARAEQFNLDLNTANERGEPISVTRSELKVLPSANLTYALTEKSNLRASYYRSLARPEFREIAPAQYYDYEFSSSFSGNTKLKTADIDNFDIRYEIYPEAGQILSISGFYKKFSNAIEGVLDDSNSLPNTSYFNSSKANVYGVELELRKTLNFINPDNFFKNTSVYSNLTFVKSEVTNSTDKDYIDKKRPMVGQAPYVINAGLQSSFLENKLSFNALYNRIGRRINKASGVLFPSIWEAPRDLVDFQVSYKVLKNKGEVKFNASDLLNNDITFYWDRDLNKKYDGNSTDETISRYKPGSNYSLSFSYTF